MSQEKRFGKRVAMPSTIQIIRELKLVARHDADLAATRTSHDAMAGRDGTATVSAGAFSRSDAT